MDTILCSERPNGYRFLWQFVEVCGSLWQIVFEIKKRGPYETDQMHACPTHRKYKMQNEQGDPFSMNTGLVLRCHQQTTEQWSIHCRGKLHAPLNRRIRHPRSRISQGTGDSPLIVPKCYGVITDRQSTREKSLSLVAR